MTHRLRRVFQWAVSLLLACLVTPVHGTHFVISSLVATDASSGSATDGIRELELYRQGLFWTVPTLAGGVEFSHQGSAGILSYRLGPISTPFYPLLGGPTLAFATRDDAFIYYTGPDGVHRKLLNASSSDAGLTIGGSWNVNEPGATMIYNDRVYYSVGNSNPFGNDGYLSIEYFSAPGAQGTFEPIFQVANGPNLASDPGPVIKMGVAYRRLAGVSGLVPYGVALTAQGLLLRFELEYNQFMVSSVGILATDVSDFAIRREQFFDNSPVHLPYYQDALYATIGRFQCAGDPRAKIATVDPLLGTQSTVWTAPDGARVLSLGLDDKYLFVSTIQATASGGLGCRTVGDGVIRAKFAPAFFTIGDNSSDPNWDPIEFNAGYNLRSDGQTLYFTYGQQIRQMPNNSPRIRLDIASAGLEAIQTVQDFNNSVPLVPGKYTLVRGYAKILDNTKGLNNLELTASLRAFRNGVELPGSPIFAGNRPTLDTLGDLPTLRTNLARSFNFEVPANWLVPGTLKLRYTVNPFASVPENADALANNSSEANLTVVPGRQPALVFKSMSSTHPNYDPESSSSGFAEIIDRAESLMPVSGFKIYFSDGSVTKPVMTFSGVKGRSFSMPDDRNWALVWMSVAHMFSDDPAPDTHWIGTLPTEDAPFNGIGGARGVKLSDLTDGFSVDFTIPHTALDNTAVVRMSANQGNSTNAWGSVVGGHTLAHELGHNYGRFHIRQPPGCGAQAPARPWQVYPFDPCTLGQPDLSDPTAPVGFDRRTRTLVAPGAAGDLMSYADSDWTSPFTWNALVAAIPVTAVEGLTGVNQVTRVRTKDDINPQPLPPHDPAFIWQGVISPDSDTATLVPGFRLPRGTIDPRKVKDSLDAAAQLPLNARFRL
ncbi:MAG TPA: hypothetical protein VMF06_06100, partial [Candidatus Limnocylindria bacterium]|nr:hypothetical protein [Candidatus Limnocylindria bacterium]